MDEAHELSLIRRVAERDIAAYRELVDAYLPRIARFAERSLGNAAEAEDVAQETFLRLWTAAAGFTPQARPSTWLYRIAHNLCVDRFRKRGRETELAEHSGADRPSGLFARKQTSLAVQQALSELPERQRSAITLVHYEGLAAQEAASVLEISVEALESLLARARRSLRERLRALAVETTKELP
ncbi:MAG TPA: sigma-70 family RNA polymerase sigma factor [Polyangiales bacterium]|nr:sigma-70 family RNA polymerase sigma factor [Polyangiales bacterium]